MLIRILSFYLGFIFLVFPLPLKASDIDTIPQDLKQDEIVVVPNQMSQDQINDLFGEDPYLGQTSYLQSPEGFTQRDE